MRNRTVDIARGGLIFYIVTIIHGVFWLQLIPPPFNWPLLFEMPLIFMVSGYAYALFEKNKGFMLTVQSYHRFLASRVVRILLPYLVYALICALLVIGQGADTSANTVTTTLLAWLNPITYGRGHTFGMLTWHLWFIWPFLLVTLLFPLLIQVYPSRIPLWVTGIGIGVLLTVIPQLQQPTRQLQTVIFYLFWFYVGYRLATGIEIGRRDFIILIVGGTAVLLLSSLLFQTTLDMQSNKFPPNSLFLIFSIIWVALFLFVFTFFEIEKVNFLADVWWFKPFISAGYSIYLWQGIGYTAATTLAAWSGLSVYIVWIVAILATTLLGMLFSPLEKIRLQ